MKATTLHEWLSSQTEILEKACGKETASGLRRISDVLAVRKDATVTEVCKVLDKVRQCGDDGARVEAIAELMHLMVKSACKFAKAADEKDLKRFSAIIESKKDESINAFVLKAITALAPRSEQATTTPSLGDDDLRAYLKRLEEALGDQQGFDAVYHQLSSDVRLKVPEAKKLAKAFVGKSGRGKADALGLIYGRHKSLMSARPKADATGGRLAG